MPVSKLKDLPIGGGGRWPLSGQGGFRSAQWGDLEVGYTVVGPANHADVYKGLPGAVCQCPHYGYVFTGIIRCTYPGSDWPDEVASAGEAYFFKAGHILSYEADTEALELNPAHALQVLMDQVEANITAMAAAGADRGAPA
jgi:hypothetical protein